MKSYYILYNRKSKEAAAEKPGDLGERELRLVGNTEALGFSLSHFHCIARDQIIKYLLLALLD